MRHSLLGMFIFTTCLLNTGCLEDKIGEASVKPDLEDIDPDGNRYTPTTQSFLRSNHWLRDVDTTTVVSKKNGKFDFSLHSASDDSRYLNISNLPSEQLLPRLFYLPGNPPDKFDGFNLMMAEYSRNGVSVPKGKGDSIAHFESNLTESVPWTLNSDFEFKANKFYKPIRVGVVNNCLAPGLWEFQATDRAGEVYHSWFTFPENEYYDLVATSNRLKTEFVKQALTWSTDEVVLNLDRLRNIALQFNPSNVSVIDQPIGYSSQDSRRKLQKGYVKVIDDDKEVIPNVLSDQYNNPVEMPEFIPPGIYSRTKRKRFDLSFLAHPTQATVSETEPLTSYSPFDKERMADFHDAKHVEIQLDLKDYAVVIGNLPMPLLVSQEDYIIHGFGVGILSSSDFSERRNFLLQGGPHPSFAYLFKNDGPRRIGVNSHDLGIEQIFIRTYPFSETPYWEITITSYERIADLIRYRVDIPNELQDKLQYYTANYVPPVYSTYVDDNLR